MAEEVLAKIFQQVQANLKDANATKLSLARKREFIHTVQECVKKLEPRKIIAVQEAVMSFVFQLASTTQSGSIVSGLVGLVRFLYQNGGDFTRLLAEFFEPAVAIISNQRTPADLRLSVIIMTGKVFKTLWNRCATPPTKELFDAYSKLNNKSTDKNVRAMAYKALKNIIKVNPSNLFQIQNDLIKHLIKQLREEKSNAVKVQLAACLNVFVEHTMNYSNMHNSFDLLFQVCLKGFEEIDDMDVHRNYVLACANLLSMRLQESQQQGEIKTGFKVYNVTLRENLNQANGKKSKNNQQGVLDVPRTFGDMISMFSAMLLRLLQNTQGITTGGETSELTNQQEGIRKAICQVMSIVAERNVAHVEAADPELILNSLVLTVPTAKEEPEESQRQRLSTVWVFQRLLKFMQEQHKVALLKLMLQTLTQKQLIIKKETLQNLTTLLPKNYKVSTMMNEAQHIALLQIVNETLYEMEPKCIQANFTDEREIMDAVVPYMAQPAPYSVRSSTVDVIRTLASKAKTWIPSMITQLLSMVNISNADVLSLKPEAVYVVEAVTDKNARTVIIDQLRTLNINAMALAAVFQHTSNSESGVPVALSTASLNLAKQLIAGQLPLEVKTDEDKAKYSLAHINSVTNQRREAGWILMEGLLMLGSDWIMTEIVLMMKLFKTVFRKEICQISAEKMAAPAYRETVFNEFMIKKRATSCLKTLLSQIKVTSEQHKNALRQVSGMICNAINFFLNHGDKQDVDKMLHKQFGTNQTHGAKADLFACLIALPLESYQSKYVTMLHPIVEAIVHEDGGPLKIPSIYKKLLQKEDSHIGPSYTQLSKNAKSKKVSEADKAPKEIQMDTRGCLWGVPGSTEYTRLLTEVRIKDFLDGNSLVPIFDALSCYPRQNLLNNAILLFTKIFLSDNLNNKNKNQLLKHFTVNVQPSATPAETSTKDKKSGGSPSVDALPYYRPDKTQKMCRIALALLSIIKSANEQDQLRIGEEQFAMILAIIASIELSRNDFLIKIAAELTVALHTPKILQDPSAALEQLIHGLESDIGSGTAQNQQLTLVQEADRTMKFQRASAILGILHRRFDYETILSPFGERMMTLMVRLFRNESPSVRKFSQHYATVMAIEGPCDDAFYKNIFLNCFHLTQVGTTLDQNQLISLGKLFNTHSKMAQEIDNRSLVVRYDFFDQLLEHKARNENAQALMVALDSVKLHILRSPEALKNEKWKTKVFEKVLSLISHKTIKSCVKVKAAELLGALIYRGYLYILDAQSKDSLTKIILDELNQIDGLESNMVDIADGFSSNLQFEKLINFSAEFNLDCRDEDAEEQSSLIQPRSSQKVYQRCLQTLYLLIIKMHCLADFKEVTQFCKSVIAYKHTTPYTILERVFADGPSDQPEAVGENYIFKQDLRDQTRCFVMETFQVFTELFFKVDTSDPNLKTMAGLLLNLGFSTVSHDSNNLKKIGFDLIISVVDLLSQCIDVVQDDDDDEDEVQTEQKKERKRIRKFMDSALLLEQYEAQIFSTIRQNLKGSTVPSFVLEQVFKLIQRFITLPICKDEQTIGRIWDLLLDGLTSDAESIYRFNLANSESVLAFKHLQKLVLVAKLVISSHHGKDFFEADQVSSSVKRKLDPTLPSKFGKEDMDRLKAAIIAASQTKVVTSHFIAILNDALVISLGKKANLKCCKLMTFGACPPQSTVGKLLNASVKYAQEALAILMCVTATSENADIKIQLSAKDSKIISMSVLQQLAQHEISGTFDPTSINTYVSGKLRELAKVKILIESESDSSSVLKASAFELSELLDSLVSLVKIGVEEINSQVLNLLRLCLRKSFFGVFNELMQAQKIECFVELVNGLLLQVLPSMLEDSMDRADSGADMNGFGQISQGGNKISTKKDLKVATSVTTQQVKAVIGFALDIVQYLKESQAEERKSIEASKSQEEAMRKVLTYTLGRLLVNFESLNGKEDGLQKDISQASIPMTELVSTSLADTPLSASVVAPCFVSSIAEYSSRVDAEESKVVSPTTAFFVHTMLKKLSQAKDQDVLAMASLMLSESLMGKAQSSQFKAQTLMLACDPISGPIGSQSLVLVFCKLRSELQRTTELSQEAQDQVLYLLGCLMKAYVSGILDAQTKVAFLQPFFTVIFSSMQNPNLSPQTRNKVVEMMFGVFQADQMAFRQFAAPNPQTGQAWLTLAEKDIIGKIVQKFSAMQAQAPTAQAGNPASGAGAKPAAGGFKQPLATAGGNKIKLGRFGKK